jgi:DEAD/DEAH box helicase domain-containing protein
MTLQKLLDRWRSDPTIQENIAAWQVIPARAAKVVEMPESMHPALRLAIAVRDIRTLYTHQARAWELVQAGKNFVVVTGTASGKTYCYNLPVVNAMLEDQSAHSLYLFPTKALAHDQLHDLRTLLADLGGEKHLPPEISPDIDYANNKPRLRGSPGPPIAVAAYDGDTPPANRPAIRENARIVLTNPDMLHTGILPHHTRWEAFFRNLRFIIIDEMHTYRGVFGSHVANVIRRLKRIARHYGSNPQFILTSATIANPLEFAQKLVEVPLALVTADGSVRGVRNFLIYNPPIIDPDLGLRRSSFLETVRLAEDLFDYKIQSIIFGQSRRAVELILTYLRERIISSPAYEAHRNGSVINKILRGYRSGYLPETRREIERGLREEAVRIVVATNALELGIDIGQMTASVLVSYPGTIASTWQQAGRAGRGENESLTILVASPNPRDQFLARHPEYLFDRSPEQALINPDNLLILLSHLRCAFFELPFGSNEIFGNLSVDDFRELVDFLEMEGTVHRSNDRVFWMSENYPADQIPLRTASPKRVLLQINHGQKPTTIGEVDFESAPWMVHPEAVYLHETETYLVESLDLDRGVAKLSQASVDYYTVPIIDTKVDLVELIEVQDVPGGTKFFGDITVTNRVKGYKRKRWVSHEAVGSGDLDLPPSILNTAGYWIRISRAAVSQLRDSGLWLNDPNRYGSGWLRTRELTRARDNYRCQVCGVSEQGQAHHVHHKRPFREFDSPDEANQLANLITVCPSCHQKIEQSARMRSGLAGLAYVLGNLAPFYLMCDSRDLSVFSDPKAELVDGEPAVVLFETIPSGIGFSARLFEIHDELISGGYDLVVNCSCTDGCPSCVGPAGETGIGGKDAALAILEILRGK